ncbi:MAG: hypothetical protein OEZ10_01300 [Gammaproteobacteria bacterium]|nr:hypothetical protein [Gammaproteobacteria bacterium]
MRPADPYIVNLVNESYNRCLRNSSFLLRFYKIFMERHELIPVLFKKTHLARQAQALSHGLSMMLRYIANPDDEVARDVLSSIRISHGQKNLNVHPRLYDYWLDSLLRAISECDPEFDEELATAWRMALLPGIEFVRSGYAEN